MLTVETKLCISKCYRNILVQFTQMGSGNGALRIDSAIAAATRWAIDIGNYPRICRLIVCVALRVCFCAINALKKSN